MEISIIPIGTKTTSVSGYVAEAVRVVRKEKGIKFSLTSMGTIIEANSIEKLFDIAGKMHNVVFSDDIKRVVTTIKIDDRKDKELTMEHKLKSVKERLKETC